jgi:aspartyl-tRNA(Asn)/glutamyl-tRNA(Gln) amidotransferase subunit A
LVKDVRDAAIMLNVLAGHDPRDPTSIPGPAKDYTAGIERGIAGLRVGVPTNFFYDRTASEVAESIRAAVTKLTVLGARVEDVELPSLRYLGVLGPAMLSEARDYLLPIVRMGPSAFADPGIWESTIVAQLVRASDVTRAMRLRNLLRQEFVETMQRFDLLITPTTPTAAFLHDAVQERLNPEDGFTYRDSATYLTFPYNLTGMPAISLPCGFTSEGLPVGLSLAGRWWEDDVVLRAAYAYEQVATGGYQAPPMIQ